MRSAAATGASTCYDTAGLRRRSKIEDKLEKLSVADALNAIRFAEVVVVLLDATRPFEEQDLRIADLVVREGRALVIGMNKSDLVERNPITPKKLREEADHWLPQAKGMPIVAVAGLTGQGLDKLGGRDRGDLRDLEQARADGGAQSLSRSRAIEQNPPPAISGGRIKLRYMTQPKARPAKLRAFRHAHARAAGILYALSRERHARGVRLARRTDPRHLSRGEESVFEAEMITPARGSSSIS